MYPAVRELKAEFGRRVTFIVADIRVDETIELGRRFNLRAIPHFVMIDANGREHHAVGSMSQQELRRLLVRGMAP
ncbi:MAG: hypothetical protein DDT37_00379 [Firmicutes bacterium]|nr:hypothetical protein [candidate division NPL-UPA2 bacterium]MBT9155412.1 hypothetical protein [candidate division NPL-UPA2 bacterium]